MTLDDFLKECEKKGSIPLSYRSHVETLNGSQTIEYENPKYREGRVKLAKMLGNLKETGNPYADNLISRLYGEDIVIKTATGYHHGQI